MLSSGDWNPHQHGRQNEKNVLETIAVQVTRAFAQDAMKDAAAVAEVTELAQVPRNEYYRFLLSTFMDTVDQSDILHLYSVEGLAKSLFEELLKESTRTTIIKKTMARAGLGEEGAIILRDVFNTIKTHESPIVAGKEGFKFKRARYRTLRSAKPYIRTGKLVQFKELDTSPSCRHQFMFQRGILPVACTVRRLSMGSEDLKA
ncbi:hypothetical protein BGZ72_005706 [Mortierella alpina]|nr:hypothetical protein BGZ72_005706 [Mortierella alpina]